MAKNHKGYYRVSGQAIFNLIAFTKKLKKSKKYRKNSRILKIPSDSVSVGPIYLSQLKNLKSVRCQVRTFWNGTFEKFYVIVKITGYLSYGRVGCNMIVLQHCSIIYDKYFVKLFVR